MKPSTPFAARLAILGLLAAVAATPALARVWEPGNLLLRASSPLAGERFGAGIVAADFDRDGLDDLAVGAPDANSEAGEVDIFLARPGRTFQLSRVFTTTQGQCHMGATLAAGRFDSNLPVSPGSVPSPASLVIGLPDCDGGLVAILSFFARDLTFHQGDISNNPAEDGDRFGAAFAVGDFNDDGYADLAIGAPGEDLGFGNDVGLVHTVFGGPDGLDVTTGETFSANGFVSLSATTGDHFGAALAAGDFNSDSIADLAIGIPGRAAGGVAESGAVQIAYGSASGITSTDQQFLTESSFGGTIQAFAHLGAVLAAGDFDGPSKCSVTTFDCADDLAIGVPDEDLAGAGEAGELIVAYGGLTFPGGERSYSRFSFGQAVEAGDHLGFALAASRHASRRATEPADLAIGVPFEDVAGLGANVGGLFLLPGSPNRVDPGHQELLETPGFASYPAAINDQFGSALAIGDFDGDGNADLAVGIPRHTAAGVLGAGAVQILYGALFADGFESGAKVHWSSASPP